MTFLPLLIALALRLASEPTADLSYVVLAAYAALGRPHAIRAFIFSWLFTMINLGIAPEASLGAAGRYAILMAAIFSVVMYRPDVRRPLDGFMSGTIILSIFFIVHSVLFSSIVDVSLLKCISWTLTVMVLFSIWIGFSDWKRERMGNELFWMLVATLVFSLPLMVSSVGYLSNKTGFQGIFNQPQVLGLTISLLTAWSTTRFLSQRQPSWTLVGVMIAGLVGILLSEARVAGLAMFGGIVGAIALSAFVSGRRILDVMPGLRSWRFWSMVCLAVAGMIIFLPTLVSLIDHYLTKSGRANVDGLADAYNTSRGILIRPMIENISRYPFSGIGFGLDSDPIMMEIVRDPFMGLPLSAAVEKGVTPLAILEETGVFGLFLVFIWVFRLVQVTARGGPVPLSVCLTALLINLAEASMFSAGGQGLLIIGLFAWSYASGRATLPQAGSRSGSTPMGRAPAFVGRPFEGAGPGGSIPGRR